VALHRDQLEGRRQIVDDADVGGVMRAVVGDGDGEEELFARHQLEIPALHVLGDREVGEVLRDHAGIEVETRLIGLQKKDAGPAGEGIRIGIDLTVTADARSGEEKVLRKLIFQLVIAGRNILEDKDTVQVGGGGTDRHIGVAGEQADGGVGDAGLVTILQAVLVGIEPDAVADHAAMDGGRAVEKQVIRPQNELIALTNDR